ncbi:hypothetical protein, partial [Fulvivirga aurantia]|uniref:hypothetical protein n=1 Tax=Fulvivirga aurantia TaxID=2529383 RepID=UPI001624DF33
GYNFYWFDGNVPTPNIAAPDFTGDTYSNLTAGDYTLVVEDDATKCTANPIVLTINETTSNPIISITAQTDQTNCDTSNPNGTIDVDADGTTAGFTFNWYTGQSTAPADEILPAPGFSITGLAAGIYT